MTRKFKVGDRVSFPMNGVTETGTIDGPCGAPNNEHGVCFRINSDKGWDGVHKREGYLTLAVMPQNLDSLAGKVDEALDRLERVEGTVKLLQKAGGSDLVGAVKLLEQVAQNPTPKFKIGDRVVVTASTHQKGKGIEATVGKLKYGAYDYGLRFASHGREGKFWGYNESELELAPERELQVGDVVRVNLPGRSSDGSEVTIIQVLPLRYDGLNYRAGTGASGGYWYAKSELTLLLTAEEDAKLKADAENDLKRRALKALEKLTFNEKMHELHTFQDTLDELAQVSAANNEGEAYDAAESEYAAIRQL